MIHSTKKIIALIVSLITGLHASSFAKATADKQDQRQDQTFLTEQMTITEYKISDMLKGHSDNNKSRPHNIFIIYQHDNLLTSTSKDMINNITNLPNDIKNLPDDIKKRAQITWQNIHAPNYKVGKIAQEIAQNYVKATNNYVYNTLGSHPEDVALQPLDSADEALVHTISTLSGAHGLGSIAYGLKFIAQKGIKSTSLKVGLISTKTVITSPVPEILLPSSQNESYPSLIDSK